MKHFLAFTLAACLLSGCASFKKSVQITADGKPTAEIVVAGDAHPAVQYASQELQTWVKAISGAQLPIVNKPSGNANAIQLAVNPDGFAEDLKAIGETDGCAVRPCPCGKGIVILGARPKGVLNGVYKTLFRNTDIIWARPDADCGTIYTPNTSLSFADTDFIDIPVYILRGWQMTGLGVNEDWQARNCMNWTAATIGYSKATEKYDPIREYGSGHNLCGLYIQEKKYYASHPEFYPLIGGQRIHHSEVAGGCQLCFTNEELKKVFIKEIDDNFRRSPFYDTYRIMIEDNERLCECENCLKPIKLADGTVITKDDESFRSTQFFLWLNPIARHIKEKYNKRVLAFAYLFTEFAPKCAIEDNISVSFCPIYKNSKYTMTHPENLPSFKRLDAWLKVTPNVTLREYYGLCWAFPRPMDIIAAEDLRYANSRGVTRTYSELRPDSGIQTCTDSWDVNAMYFWVMTQLVWNPYQNVNDLRRTFLDRVYGSAAPDVEKFYAIIEKSWFATRGFSDWRDKCRANWRLHVLKPGLVEQCRAPLDAAAIRQLAPAQSTMLSRLRKIFDQNTKSGAMGSMSTRKVSKTPAFDPIFASGDWSRTRLTDAFITSSGSKQKYPTHVRILHDDKAFYIGASCDTPFIDKVACIKPAGVPRDTWLGGEKFELLLTGLDDQGKPAAFQFVVTPTGNLYDARNNDFKWNGEIETKLDRRSDGWSVMLTIPYKTLGLNAVPNDTKIGFLRYVSLSDRETDIGYWNEIAPDIPECYTPLLFK